MHENHPSIILILVHYDIQHESLHSEKDPLLLLLLESRTEFSLLPNKKTVKNNKMGTDIVDMDIRVPQNV